MIKSHKASNNENELLTKEELAAKLKLTPRTIQSYVDSRRIPFLRLSPRCLRFKLCDVIAAFEKAGGAL